MEEDVFLMSAAIGGELAEFLNCLWYGIVLCSVYDGLRILRAVFRHVGWLTGLEDFLFWIWAALFLFSHFFQDTYGAVRSYQLLGTGIGGLFWEYGCGRFLTKKIIFFVRQLKFCIARCKILTDICNRISPKRERVRADESAGDRNEKKEKG